MEPDGIASPSAQDFLRIRQLPPYPLGEIAHAVRDARLAGRDIIDLSQMNPDLGPPGAAVDKLVQACLQSHNHRYSASQGITKLREAIAKWYDHRYKISLDPDREIVVTMGTKEGLSHLLLSLVAPGDTVLVLTPGYPIHTSAVALAGAGFIGVPLFASSDAAGRANYVLRENDDNFFERLELTYMRSWPRPSTLICSFPHNPTTTTVTEGFFNRLIEFAKTKQFFIVHDFAYADICFDGVRAPSILADSRNRETAVECYSLSKGFGLAGWRIGFCLGNARLVAALKKIKGYLDFGVFQPLQIAAATLLESPERHGVPILEEVVATYQHRRDVMVPGLRELDWQFHTPAATPFIWARLPDNARTSGSFAYSRRILESANVAICPGAGFDVQADDYMRFALVDNERRLREGLLRMRNEISRE